MGLSSLEVEWASLLTSTSSSSSLLLLLLLSDPSSSEATSTSPSRKSFSTESWLDRRRAAFLPLTEPENWTCFLSSVPEPEQGDSGRSRLLWLGSALGQRGSERGTRELPTGLRMGLRMGLLLGLCFRMLLGEGTVLGLKAGSLLSTDEFGETCKSLFLGTGLGGFGEPCECSELSED